jgi:hypothetical protein
MAINFGDLASFTKGVVDADKAATEARLKDRQAELLADRQLYIDMKTKKYESELKSFEEENKKYKAVQAVNAKFEGSETPVIPSDYGRAYLMETNPQLLLQYETLYKDNPNQLNKALSTFGDKSIVDFKTTNTRDALDNKLKTDIDAITAGYKKALENARGDSKLINAILGKRDKEIKLVIEKNKEGETGAIAAKEIATQTDTNESRGFEFGEEPEVANDYLFRKWKKDSKIQDLRKDVKGKVSSIHKGTINTTLNTLSSLNISLPKQFLTFDQGKTSGTITGIKDKGKIVVEHINLLDNQALNFMSNEWIFSKDTDATNVSNYYSEIEAENLVTSRVRDYSSEGTVSQQKKGFWKDRENFVGFVPFSVVGLDNDFIYKEDGGGVTINSSNRKQVGNLYYQTLKKIAVANDPEFKNSTEAEAINRLQDKLLKLKEGESSNLLTQVKNEMVKDMGLDKPAESNNQTSTEIATNNTESDTEVRVVYNGKSIIVNEESTKLFKDNGVDINTLPKDNVTNKKTTTSISSNEDEKIIDSITNENVTKPIKKTPADFGQVNQPVFETLESIRKVMTMPMTGEEIKNTFDISPGLKINSKTIFRPIS